VTGGLSGKKTHWVADVWRPKTESNCASSWDTEQACVRTTRKGCVCQSNHWQVYSLVASVQRVLTIHFRFSNMARAFIAMAQLGEQPPVDAYVHPEPPYNEDDPIKDGMKCYYAGCIGGRQLSTTTYPSDPASLVSHALSVFAVPIPHILASPLQFSFVLYPRTLVSLTQISPLIHCPSSVCPYLSSFRSPIASIMYYVSSSPIILPSVTHLPVGSAPRRSLVI